MTVNGAVPVITLFIGVLVVDITANGFLLLILIIFDVVLDNPKLSYTVRDTV